MIRSIYSSSPNGKICLGFSMSSSNSSTSFAFKASSPLEARRTFTNQSMSLICCSLILNKEWKRIY